MIEEKIKKLLKERKWTFADFQDDSRRKIKSNI